MSRRVLVVDGNPSVHAMFRRALTAAPEEAAHDAGHGEARAADGEEDFTVECVFNGTEAVKLSVASLENATPFAMAFIAVENSDKSDAGELVERLWRADPALEVVLCSRAGASAWAKVSKRLGHADQLLFVRTPLDRAEVLQLAHTLTHKWGLKRQLSQSLRSSNARLMHDAFHDALTSLPNRALLLERLGQSLKRVERAEGSRCAVLFLDLDNFKVINDSLGHRAGDSLLVEVATRLTAVVRSADTVGRPNGNLAARLGGDEFVVLLEDVRDAGEAMKVAERVREEVCRPLSLDGRDVAIDVSVGIALDGGSRAPEDLLREADTAMYRAKSQGKGRCAVFDDRMHAEVLERMQLGSDLRYAIDRRQLSLTYQPIVEIETGQLSGFEALMRWQHPTRGMVSPEVFVPIAEETGLIDRLGLWAVAQACHAMAGWRERTAKADTVYVSVNVSRRQLIGQSFTEHVGKIFEKMGVPGRRIYFEITESAVMTNPNDAVQTLTKLRGLGSEIMLDDFGTGHSSIACLHRYPIGVLKIDRSFVYTMQRSTDYAAVVHSIVTLAHNLRAKVVAEGVETNHQLVQLQALDCDYAQGFYFSRPLQEADAEEVLVYGHLARQDAA